MERNGKHIQSENRFIKVETVAIFTGYKSVIIMYAYFSS